MIESLSIEEKKCFDSIGEIFFKGCIEYLLVTKQISKNVTKEQLYKKIGELIESDFLEEVCITLTITDETYKLFKEQFDKKNKNMSIILAATYLEQLINEFYQEFLILKKKLTKKECDECLKSLKIRDKFGWFYKLCFQKRFDKKLINYVDVLFRSRNSIIHHIPIMENIDDETDYNFKLDYDELKNNLDMIRKILQEKSNELFKNKEISNVIFEKYYSKRD